MKITKLIFPALMYLAIINYGYITINEILHVNTDDTSQVLRVTGLALMILLILYFTLSTSKLILFGPYFFEGKKLPETFTKKVVVKKLNLLQICMGALVLLYGIMSTLHISFVLIPLSEVEGTDLSKSPLLGHLLLGVVLIAYPIVAFIYSLRLKLDDTA